MKSDINNDLSKLNEWAKLWLVDFNPKKTKALIISTSAVPHLDLRFNGEPVEIVKNHKHLGLTFTSDGNWSNHIDNIVRERPFNLKKWGGGVEYGFFSKKYSGSQCC
jgi:hypothetical protein